MSRRISTNFAGAVARMLRWGAVCGSLPSMIRDLWPWLCRWLLVAALISPAYVLALFCDLGRAEVVLGIISGCIGLVTFSLIQWMDRELWQFAARVRGIRTARGNRFVLRYAPELHGVMNPEEMLRRAEGVLAAMEETLGRLTFWNGNWTVHPLLRRRKVYLFLFRSVEALQEIVGENAAAGYMPGLFCIAMSYEETPFDQCLKHELTHVFSFRWNLGASPLLSEGLATWLEGTKWGDSIDSLAASMIGPDPVRLCHIVPAAKFEEHRGRADVLAGSFTGFLLRQFGWDAFKRLYCRRLRTIVEFEKEFEKEFGQSLETAERSWQAELLRSSATA